MKTLTFKNVAGLVTVLGLTVNMVALSAGNSSEQNTFARVKVKTALVLTKLQDLAFTDAYQGDAEEVLAPSSPGAASFSLVGDNSKNYLVEFPDGASIVMTTAGGGTAQKEIVVSGFSHDSTGAISGGGATFHVGATRATLAVDQEAGDYEGSFRVRVTYN